MKRSGIYIILFFFIAFTMTLAVRTASPGALSVKNSKHDLSSASTGATYKSVDPASDSRGTTEICVFCHTPHSGNTDAPLWNRKNPSGPYNDRYYSDVMSALSYSQPEDPLNAAHVKTRICLSCHDGTIALGSMVNLPTGHSEDIPIQGLADGRMPTSAAGYIGTDLRDDHPVAIKYSSGSPDAELLSVSGSSPIKFYNNYVECTSCHNAHDNQYGNFLVMSNQYSAICTTCHSKTGFAASIHGTSNPIFLYSPSTGGTPSTLGGNVGEVKCMNCHFPHKAGVLDTNKTNPEPTKGTYLLSFKEEQSCFNSNNDRWNTSGSSGACHGSAAATDRNIESVLAKSYKHNMGLAGVHTASEVRGITFPWAPGTTPHVECADCHNPHTAGSTLHTQGTNTVTSATSPLYGAGGVYVNAAWPGNWTPVTPSVFYAYREPYGLIGTANNSVQYEYEICFKCHSSANQNLTNWNPNWTDMALEFNPNNQSYHPVVQALPATDTGGSSRLTAAQMGGSWTVGVGKPMFCSDCHGNDTTTGQAQGPHGSSKQFILKGTNVYWPVDASSALYTLNGVKTGLFCMNCHPDPRLTNNNAHNRSEHNSAACINCHILVPHGGAMSRLIGDRNGTMPTRYAYQGLLTNMMILSFTKATNQTTYTDIGNCEVQSSSSGGCDNAAIHTAAHTENW